MLLFYNVIVSKSKELLKVTVLVNLLGSCFAPLSLNTIRCLKYNAKQNYKCRKCLYIKNLYDSSVSTENVNTF